MQRRKFFGLSLGAVFGSIFGLRGVFAAKSRSVDLCELCHTRAARVRYWEMSTEKFVKMCRRCEDWRNRPRVYIPAP